METGSHKLTIYQVFTRLFGNRNTTRKPYGTIEENGCGKFEDFSETALRAIRESGFSHIWFTGVIQHATVTDYSAFGIPKDHPDVVKGRAGSPYAITDYYSVDPDLVHDVPNRMAEFEALLARTRQAGLKSIIDFVPNHVARTYRSIARPEGVEDFGQTDDTTKAFSPTNNFYYLPGQALKLPKNAINPHYHGQAAEYHEMPARATGNDCFKANPSEYDWFETIKLNYGVDYLNNRATHFDPIPNTWLKMRDILFFWAAKGVDGFRCDMAELVPIEFWAWLLPQAKERFPGIIFIAEVYNTNQYREYLDEARFDYLYDKAGLYDLLRAIMKEEKKAEEIGRMLHEQGPFAPHMLRFLENHDEHRIASSQFAGNPWAAWPAMVLSALVHTGPVMIYFGQELGEKGNDTEGFSGPDGKTSIFDYWSLPSLQRWQNHDRYDGGLLTDAEQRLRSAYVRLLHLCRQEPFSTGAFFDLQIFNPKSADYSTDYLYSFLRYIPGQDAYLIVLNLNPQLFKIARLHIPPTVFEQIFWPQPEQPLQLEECLSGNGKIFACTGLPTTGVEVRLNIPAAGAFVFKLKH